MNNSTYKLIEKCLKFSISKDETGFILNGVYYDDSTLDAVSTDGYILTKSRLMYMPELANLIVNYTDMTIIRRDYLKWQSVIPNKFEHNVVVNFPKNDSVIKGKNQREYGAFILNDSRLVISSNVPENALVKLNPHFLKPLQGYTLEVGLNGPLNPIRVSLDGTEDNIYIIMPMKM